MNSGANDLTNSTGNKFEYDFTPKNIPCLIDDKVNSEIHPLNRNNAENNNSKSIDDIDSYELMENKRTTMNKFDTENNILKFPSNSDNDIIFNNYFNQASQLKSNLKKSEFDIINSNSSKNTSFHKIGKNTSKIGWTFEEDKRLKEAIEIYGDLSWKIISDYVGTGKTRSQCSQRWNRCLKPNLTKGKWSKEEIELLTKLVNKYGDGCWARIASKMENRCDIQCRYMYRKLMRQKNNQNSDDLSFEYNIQTDFNNLKLGSQNPVNYFEFLPQQMPMNAPHICYASKNCNNDPKEKKINLTKKSIFPVSDNLLSIFHTNGMPENNNESKEQIDDTFQQNLIYDLFPMKSLDENDQEIDLNPINFFM